MKFLFLDLLSANKISVESKICLINQTLVDDDFNIITKKELLINPMVDFDEYILKNINYSKNDFDDSKNFNEIYPLLKEDFEQEEQVIIIRNGYNDVRLLKNECENRSLKVFTFKFYDFNEILLAYKKNVNEESFNLISKAMFTKDGSNNVELMLEILKQICEKTGKSLREILSMAVNSEGYLQDGYISFRRTKDIINPDNKFNSNLNKNSNYKVFLRLLENVEKNTNSETVLKDKNISISVGFETENFKEMVNLVLWLNEAGASYVTDVSKCDMFIKYDIFNNSKLRKCSRLDKIEQLKTDGKIIEILSIEEILKILNKTKEELFNSNLPNLDFIYGENSKQAKQFKKYTKIRKNFGKI